MAKVEFHKSANEGRHVFCGKLAIELNGNDVDKIIFGKTVSANLKTNDFDILLHVKEASTIKKRKK